MQMELAMKFQKRKRSEWGQPMVHSSNSRAGQDEVTNIEIVLEHIINFINKRHTCGNILMHFHLCPQNCKGFGNCKGNKNPKLFIVQLLLNDPNPKGEYTSKSHENFT